MLPLLLLWACAAAVRGLQPCTSSKWDDAFLADVTRGLPDAARAEFCDDTQSSRFITSPSDTGISHYVLPSSVAAGELGNADGAYTLLRVGQLPPDDAEQVPVLLHLWLRAMCSGYACMAVPAVGEYVYASRHAPTFPTVDSYVPAGPPQASVVLGSCKLCILHIWFRDKLSLK